MTSNRPLKFLDRILGAVARRYARRARARSRRRPPETWEQAQSILVSKLCCMGDSILALSALRNLKRRYPRARLTVLTSRRAAAVYERHAFIDEIQELPFTGTAGVRDLLRLPAVWNRLRGLRGRRFDLFLDLDLYYRFTPLVPAWLDIPCSAGLLVTGKPDWYDFSMVRGPDQPEASVFQDLLQPLDVPRDFSLFPWPLNRAEEEWAAARLAEAGEAPPGGWVAFFPGASPNWPQKKWPLDYFHRVACGLWDRHRAGAVWLGAAADRAGFSPGDAPPPFIDLIGKTSFHRLAAVLARCRLALGNDSGPLHLADSLGRPVVTIFGPTNPRKWAPLHQPENIVCAGLPCAPCYHLSFMPECPRGRECLTGLLPEKVLSFVNKFF
jgi:ADP-heptose:LPS heptosyltransferase